MAYRKVAPGDVYEGTLTHVKFTCNSPFGEQWSTIKLDDGDTIYIATWIDYSSSAKEENSPRSGDRVEVKIGHNKNCSMFGGTVICKPCAYYIKKLNTYQHLRKLLNNCAQGEHSCLTCVKMALKWGDEDPDNGYDAAMPVLKSEIDKLRMPQSEAGKKLYQLIKWSSMLQIEGEQE